MLFRDRKSRSGQALIELTIALSAALFMTFAGVGMLRFSMTAPWLDELLFLRLDFAEPPSDQNLAIIPERDGSLPEPLMGGDLAFLRQDGTPEVAILPLHRKIRAAMRVDEGILRLDAAGNGIIPATISASSYSGTVERVLGTVPYSPPEEGRVRKTIKGLFLLGLGQGPLTETARSLGIELVHLNLDSLPLGVAGDDRNR